MPPHRERCPLSSIVPREKKTAEPGSPAVLLRVLQLVELCFLFVPIGIDRREVVPLLREIVQRENSGHRADRDAGSAVDAFDGVYIELRLAFVRWLVLAG